MEKLLNLEPAKECCVPYHYTWEILDSSKLQDFLTCPRRFFYRYVLGWAPAGVSHHLLFGEGIHRALAHLYKTQDFSFENALVAFSDHFLPFYRQHVPEDMDAHLAPKTGENALTAITKYAQERASDLDRYEIVNVEISGAVPFSPYDDLLHFRLDVVVRDKVTGLYSALEHKTASSTWKWEMQWPLKIQIGTYTHALYTIIGDPQQVAGVQVNGLFFAKRKVDPISLMRVPVFRTLEHMGVWYSTVLRTIQAISYEFQILVEEDSEDASTMVSFPLNSESCTKYTGCEYHHLCTTRANPLARLDEGPPDGFEVSYWDPSEGDTNEV